MGSFRGGLGVGCGADAGVDILTLVSVSVSVSHFRVAAWCDLIRSMGRAGRTLVLEARKGNEFQSRLISLSAELSSLWWTVLSLIWIQG